MKDRFPITLDGELVYLINPYRADFEHLQIRGRLKRTEAIESTADRRAAFWHLISSFWKAPAPSHYRM